MCRELRIEGAEGEGGREDATVVVVTAMEAAAKVKAGGTIQD